MAEIAPPEDQVPLGWWTEDPADWKPYPNSTCTWCGAGDGHTADECVD